MKRLLPAVVALLLVHAVRAQTMVGSNNLSELTNPSIARANLGIDDVDPHPSAGSALALNAVTGVHVIGLNSSSCNLSITTWATVRSLVLVIKQDATGGRQINWSAVTSNPPEIDLAPNAVTIVTLFTVDGGTNVFAFSSAQGGGGGGGGGAPQAFATLTESSGTVEWTVNPTYARQNAKVTLTGNRALSIVGASSGMHGTLLVTQDGTGSRTLALPSGSRVEGGGAGALTLSTSAGATDKVSWTYDGSNFHFDAPKLLYTAAGGLTQVDSNTTAGPRDYVNVAELSSGLACGGAFQASQTATIVAVDVSLARVNSPGNYHVQIWSLDTSTNGGQPNALIATSTSVNLGSISAWPTYEWVRFTGLSAALTSGQKYVIILTRTGGTVDGTHYVRWEDASYPGGDPGHNTAWKSSDLSSWTAYDIGNGDTFKFKTFKN